MTARPFILHEANYRQLREYRPTVAVLPWGATEAHNFHLPHGVDVIEASRVAERAAELAHTRGGKPILLPTIPFGNQSQQLDQIATIHLGTETALHLLRDVCESLRRQSIDRLILVNGHGGNEFRPLVRDLQRESGLLIVVVNFWQLAPDVARRTFEQPGDHADEMETSLLLHLRPDWVVMEQAGEGQRVPFTIPGVNQPGVWTPRPWKQSHPDTGSGNPAKATAEKGRVFFEAVADALAVLIVGVSNAKKGELPYV